jgi:hypothetical protein
VSDALGCDNHGTPPLNPVPVETDFEEKPGVRISEGIRIVQRQPAKFVRNEEALWMLQDLRMPRHGPNDT